MPDHKLRLILVLLLFLALFIAVPLFMLRASGYRLDASKWRLVATGSIAVTAVPIGSEVTIKGDKVETKNTSVFSTTTYFPDLLPGTYSVTATAMERGSWTKTVEVKEKQTTSFAFVRLFPEKLAPTWSLKRTPNQLLLDPEEELLVAWDKEGLFVHQIGDGAEAPAIGRTLAGTVKRATWFSKDRLLVTFTSGAIVLLGDVRSNTPRVTPLPPNIKDAEALTDERLILHTTEGTLILVEVPRGEELPSPLTWETIAENVPLFATHGNAISYLDMQGTLWTLQDDFMEPKQRSIIGLDVEKISKLTASVHGTQFIAIDNSGGAWLLGKDDDRFNFIAEGIRDARFSFDDRKVLLIGTRELTLYATENRPEQPIRTKGARETITRFSAPILSAELLTPEEEYVIVLTDDSNLSIIELDPRGGQNAWRQDNISAYASQTNPPLLYIVKNDASLSIIPIPIPGLLTQLLL